MDLDSPHLEVRKKNKTGDWLVESLLVWSGKAARKGNEVFKRVVSMSRLAFPNTQDGTVLFVAWIEACIKVISVPVKRDSWGRWRGRRAPEAATERQRQRERERERERERLSPECSRESSLHEFSRNKQLAYRILMRCLHAMR
jgi:hypothetical protein